MAQADPNNGRGLCIHDIPFHIADTFHHTYHFVNSSPIHIEKMSYQIPRGHFQAHPVIGPSSMRSHTQERHAVVTGGRNLLVDGPSLSMPFLLFIDGFGIFRNTYPSLKGFYLTPASLPYAERRKESNMFTLTLGPHGIKEGTEVPRPESPGLKLKKRAATYP
jgi:hypothetical protein